MSEHTTDTVIGNKDETIRRLIEERDEWKKLASCMLSEIAKDWSLIEIGRKAIEDVLIENRDSRISIHGRGNGLVACERDGSPSNLIRFGTPEALRWGILAIAKYLEQKGGA